MVIIEPPLPVFHSLLHRLRPDGLHYIRRDESILDVTRTFYLAHIRVLVGSASVLCITLVLFVCRVMTFTQCNTNLKTKYEHIQPH